MEEMTWSQIVALIIAGAFLLIMLIAWVLYSNTGSSLVSSFFSAWSR